LTEKVAMPLLVFCGVVVSIVVFAVPVDFVKPTEKVPAGERLFWLSTMLTVAIDVEEPSLMM
jgi:hypothetical protein